MNASALVAATIAATAPVVDPRALRLANAANPAPSAVERGPVARLHYRHALDIDPVLASVAVDTPAAPVEWPALLAETHASLLDPSGLTPLARPSPLGSNVLDALKAHDSWQRLADASKAHPLVAREAVAGLASVVLDALKRSGAKPETDTRRSLADLDAARAALERARAAQRTATDPAERAKAMREAIKAQQDEERAKGACAADDGIARRTGERIDDAGQALDAIADKAEERADAAHAFSNAVGSGVGVGGSQPIPDEVVRVLTPEVVKMMRMVGALRKALSEGRAARHVRGREGMIGVAHGGLNDVADLGMLTLASLGGHLGDAYANLTRLALVENRAEVIAKGGGIARNGHVVLIADQSGSTQGARQVWIGALCIAVALEARADGRTVAVVCFDERVSYSGVIDSPASLARAIVALSSPTYGGTNVRVALTEGARLLALMPHGGDPADGLLVTDGAWDAADAAGWPDTARLRGAFIGGSPPPGVKLASAWEVRAMSGSEAVTIAKSIV